MAESQPLLLTIPEAARELGISPSQAYILARNGELPTVRIGRSVRISRRALDSWCALRERDASRSTPQNW